MNNGIGKPMNLLFNKVYGNGMMPLKKRDQVNKSLETLQTNKLQVNVLPISQGEEEKYTKLLNSFNMPVKEDLIQGLKVLDFHGIHLSKENLVQYISTKNHLNDLVQELNYDTALKLMEEQVDLEKDSLQEVVDKLEKVKAEEEDQPLSLSKIIKKFKKLSTEDAEKIAEKIYGSKQGKDVTDIIKALQRAGVEVTKESIEKVKAIFTKLHSIQNYDEEGFVEAIKHKVEGNINQLYKLKNSIKKGAIAIEEKLSQYATKVYGGFLGNKNQPTEKDLRLLEEDIKRLLTADGQVVNKENISLSKALIRQGMEVNKENLSKVMELKALIGELNSSLDQDNVSLLMKAGYDIESENLSKLLDLVKNIDSLKAEMLQMETLPLSEEEKIGEMLGKIKLLGEAKEEDLLMLLKKGTDFKLGDLHRVKAPMGFDQELILQGGQEIHYSALKVVKLFSQLNKITPNNLTGHIKNNYPLTIEGLANNIPETSKLGIIKASNEAQQAFKELNFIRQHLTSSMVTKGLEKGLSLEKMELPRISNYINEHNLQEGNWEQIKVLPQIRKQGEDILALLMKNNLPHNLGEMKQISNFLKNQQQVGHQVQELMEFLEKEGNEALKLEVKGMKEMAKDLTNSLKNGKMDLSRFNKELNEIVNNIAQKGSLLDDKSKEQLYKNIEKLSEAIDTQNQLNHRDTTVQMPIMMDNQMKNLQIYVMKDKQGSKKIDPKNMSVLLNMDTNNMGNINIYLGVNYRQLVLKVGVLYKEYQEMIEPQIPALKDMLSKIGYEVKDIAFRVDEDLHLMSMVEEVADKQKGVNFIDMMI
ncbi:DUF6240 domain-containing protein [Alkaliphilus hydrothermalis]|uniref:Flagellar hook-length control protein FliK n=1 Tax=Alkaliphilus hydrothermalis TaxID=1482730 RepID=A0ABS2NR38_9FIRM|nr:DUF6240 domain-containing protein [Alkaliphilus hydrothermalis]MBM7615403.1 hypothetical protein [Alkaliphilus hydrothermalis]